MADFIDMIPDVPGVNVFQGSLGDFYFDIQQFTHGTSMPFFHYHDSYEFYYMKRGRKTYIIDDEKYDLTTSDLMIVHPGEKHRAVSPDNKPQQRMIFYFNESSFTLFADVIGDYMSPGVATCHKLTFPTDKLIAMSNLFDRISTFSNDDLGDRLKLARIECTMFELVCQINEIAVRNGGRRDGNSAIKEAMEHITRNHGSDITLKSVSESVFMSPNYFSTLFHEYTGMTFGEYLTDVRVRHAMRLLSDTGESVSKIASDCGFSSPNYMSDTFRKVTGRSPSEYRRIKKESDSIKLHDPE